MKTVLTTMLVGLLVAALLVPNAAAGPHGFGRCELQDESYGTAPEPVGEIVLPTNLECYWSGPGGGCWITYTTLYNDQGLPNVQIPTGYECGY
ncbi:MAG: hypothetical protein ACPGQL_01260 [Thermoplasmatota archaeon]